MRWTHLARDLVSGRQYKGSCGAGAGAMCCHQDGGPLHLLLIRASCSAGQRPGAPLYHMLEGWRDWDTVVSTPAFHASNTCEGGDMVASAVESSSWGTLHRKKETETNVWKIMEVSDTMTGYGI